MTPLSIRSVYVDGMQNLQLFNQNTLHICHNMLRHLPRNKSAFANVHQGFHIDRVSEIEDFLTDQISQLIEASGQDSVNASYGIEIPQLVYRSATEKRFTSLLNHFVNYSKRNNPKAYESLYVDYSDSSKGRWSKEKLDNVGGILKSDNSMKLFSFAKAVANSADPNNELTLHPPLIKEPSKNLEAIEEQERLLMPLIKNGSFNLDPDMSEEEALRLIDEIQKYSEALTFKENSLKLRKETLMSIYRGNPNGVVRDMIMGTNAMSMDLKREQMILRDAVKSVSEFSIAHNYKQAELAIDATNETISRYSLIKDDKLSFIIPSERLDKIKFEDKTYDYEIPTGLR